MKVYVAGLGLSSGGHFSQVFRSEQKAREYVEGLFEDDVSDREWSWEKVIDQDPDAGLSVEGERLYYGFEKDRKGFIMEKEVEHQ
jgi:hypothetical protein